jgi:hypothetical protein
MELVGKFLEFDWSLRRDERESIWATARWKIIED